MDAPVVGCEVDGSDATAGDVEILRKWLATVDGFADEHFRSLGGKKALMERFVCRFHISGAPDADLAYWRTRTTSSGYLGGTSHRIRVIAPSMLDDTDVESLRESIARKYLGFFGNAALKQQPAKRSKPPPFWRHGYRTYLAAIVPWPDGPPGSRRLDAAIAASCSDPSRVPVTFEVADPTHDGLAVVAMLHEEFGRDQVLRLLVSTEREFWDAVRTELGVDARGLHGRWRTWLQRWCAAHR